MYDAADRLTERYDPLVESGTDKYAAFVYEGTRRTRAIDHKGVVTKFEYDDIDRLLATVEDFHQSGGGDTANTRTEYDYNGAGQVTALRDHDDHETCYEYDDAGRLELVTYPDTGDVVYTRDAAGNIETRTDQRGIVTTYTHNDLHQLISREYSTQREEVFTWNRSGQLLTADNDWSEITFVYDALRRMSSTTQDFGGSDYTTEYDYTVGPAGSTRTIEYPGGRTVVETFDLRGRLEEVSGGTGVGAEWTFDGANRRTAAALANGVDSVFDFDVNSRLTRITHAKDSTTLFDVGFGYDENGTKLFSRDYVFTTRSELYGHDPRRRLRGMERGTLNTGGTAITTPLADVNLASAQGWPDLDRRGNWPTFEQTVNGNSSEQTRLANGVNEYTLIDPDGGGQQSAVSLTYDDAGNLLQDPETFWSYEYDEENRLRYAESYDQYDSLDIWYDALGRRIFTYDFSMYGPHQGPVDHVYSGLSVIEEYEVAVSGTVPAREFVWGASFTEPVVMIDHTSAGAVGAGTAEVLHYLHGALGSVTALTDDSGAVVERYFYDPYGKTYIYNSGGTLLSQSAFGNPFGWTGQRYDPSVKLYHFWARTYSPALGRWLQRDPLGYVDGVGLYEYVVSSPSSAVDPLGMWLLPHPEIGPGNGITGPSGPPPAAPKPPKPPRKVGPSGVPITGSERPYDPARWNDDCLRKQNNCYAYAVGNGRNNRPPDPQVPGYGRKPQPGVRCGKPAKDPTNVDQVRTAAEADGVR